MQNSQIHMILMGKGGVGKSTISSFISQYLQKRSDHPTYCADTDPINPTFSSYKSLDVEYFNISTPDLNIDKSRFDALVEKLAELDGPAVIDNGASSFLPMMSYSIESKFIDFLNECGKEVVVHAVLIGGQGQNETLRALAAILEKLPTKVVVWLNEFLGPILINEKEFEESKLYSDHRQKILGIVKIPQRSPDTFGKDLDQMTRSSLTFSEVAKSTDFKLMQKQRLKVVERDIADQLDVILARLTPRKLPCKIKSIQK